MVKAGLSLFLNHQVFEIVMKSRSADSKKPAGRNPAGCQDRKMRSRSGGVAQTRDHRDDVVHHVFHQHAVVAFRHHADERLRARRTDDKAP